MSRYLLTALLFVCCSSAVRGQNSFVVSPHVVDEAINVCHSPGDGSLVVFTTGDIGGMTTSTLSSAGGHFNPQVAIESGIAFAPFPDQNTVSKFFKLTAPPAAQDSWNFNAGYYFGDAQIDLTWSGSLDPRGSWADAPGGGPYLVWIPEPSTAILLCLGFLSQGAWWRRR